MNEEREKKPAVLGAADEISRISEASLLAKATFEMSGVAELVRPLDLSRVQINESLSESMRAALLAKPTPAEGEDI